MNLSIWNQESGITQSTNQESTNQGSHLSNSQTRPSQKSDGARVETTLSFIELRLRRATVQQHATKQTQRVGTSNRSHSGQTSASILWLEGDATRMLLDVRDEDGFCRFASPANVAIRARVSPAAAVAALGRFQRPDLRTPEDEDQERRVERVERGYIVLDVVKHRERVTSEKIRRQDAESDEHWKGLSLG